jgi:hypothetical protein
MKQVAYLIEPPRQDITNLYDTYDVRYVFRNRSQADLFRDDPEKFLEYVQAWAKTNFDPATNFFVLTGNLTMVVAAALGLAKQFATSRLLFLRYDHGLQRYCEASLGSSYAEVE